MFQNISNDFDFTVSYQHEVATKSNSSLMDFETSPQFMNKPRRGRGRGSRGSYKPRSRVKLADKSLPNNCKFQRVCINPEILRRLGYLNSNSNEQKESNKPHASITPTLPQQQQQQKIKSSNNSCCLNPIEMLHPNDPNRNQANFNDTNISFLDITRQNQNIFYDQNYQSSTVPPKHGAEIFLDLDSQTDENKYFFQIKKNNSNENFSFSTFYSSKDSEQTSELSFTMIDDDLPFKNCT